MELGTVIAAAALFWVVLYLFWHPILRAAGLEGADGQPVGGQL